MLQQEVEKFKEIAPLILPELLGNAEMGENDLVGDTGLIPYTLSGEYELEEVMDMLEDQMELTILYHFMPSKQTDFGHQCCAYSDPTFGHMFKIHVVTNGAGKVNAMTWTAMRDREGSFINGASNSCWPSSAKHVVLWNMLSMNIWRKQSRNTEPG